MTGEKKKRAPGKVVFIAALGGSLIFASPAMRDFVDGWEVGRADPLVVYADKLAGGLPTVCSGITRHVTKTPIVVGERWTHEKCEREEQAAWSTMQHRLVKCFTKLPPQSVFDMGSSHAWNNGVSATCGSAALRAWNAGDYVVGCRRLAYSDAGRPVWSYAKTGRIVNGKPEMKFVRGLANRRVAEDGVCRKLKDYQPGVAE